MWLMSLAKHQRKEAAQGFIWAICKWRYGKAIKVPGHTYPVSVLYRCIRVGIHAMTVSDRVFDPQGVVDNHQDDF